MKCSLLVFSFDGLLPVSELRNLRLIRGPKMFSCFFFFSFSFSFILGAFWFFEVILGYGARCGLRFFFGTWTFQPLLFVRLLSLTEIFIAPSLSTGTAAT